MSRVRRGRLKSGCKFVLHVQATFCYLCGVIQRSSTILIFKMGHTVLDAMAERSIEVLPPFVQLMRGAGCKRCANDLSTALGPLEKHRTIEDKRRRKRRCLALGLA